MIIKSQFTKARRLKVTVSFFLGPTIQNLIASRKQREVFFGFIFLSHLQKTIFAIFSLEMKQMIVAINRIVLYFDSLDHYIVKFSLVLLIRSLSNANQKLIFHAFLLSSQM